MLRRYLNDLDNMIVCLNLDVDIEAGLRSCHIVFWDIISNNVKGRCSSLEPLPEAAVGGLCLDHGSEIRCFPWKTVRQGLVWSNLNG